jgi:hypothetical protein
MALVQDSIGFVRNLRVLRKGVINQSGPAALNSRAALIGSGYFTGRKLRLNRAGDGTRAFIFCCLFYLLIP